MEIPGRRRRPPRENVVPLINVVFLLLIFFLLAGTLRRPDPLGVEPPESSVSAPEIAGARSVSLGASGELAIDGEPVEIGGLAAALSPWLGVEEAPTWVLRADASAAASELIPVLDALRDAGLDRIELSVRPPADR